MSHLNYTSKSKKGQHLSYEERQKIEILLKAKHKPEEIGKLLGGRSKRTIQREIALGKVKLLNSDLTYRTEYSADAAQNKRDFNNTAKGPRLKLGANFKLIEFIENKIIKDKYSPAAALAEVRKKGYEVNFCVKTLYNYIDEGLFLKLTNDDLPIKKIGNKRPYHHVRAAYTQKGKSIEERPEEAENKEVFGHWEFDKLERRLGTKKFRETFKTITCDNGCENLDFKGMEKSVLTNIPGTQVFYAHPYSAWERGANECANKLIRRFIPKGTDISKYPKKFIRFIQHWMNNYPRKKLAWLSPFDASLPLNLSPNLW